MLCLGEQGPGRCLVPAQLPKKCYAGGSCQAAAGSIPLVKAGGVPVDWPSLARWCVQIIADADRSIAKQFGELLAQGPAAYMVRSRSGLEATT